MAFEFLGMCWRQLCSREPIWMIEGADRGWAWLSAFDGVEAGDGAGGAGWSGVYGGEVIVVDERKKVVVGRVIEDVFVPTIFNVEAFDVSTTIAEQSDELAVVRAAEEKKYARSIGGSGDGAPWEDTFVEDDVSCGGNASDVAKKDVEGAGGVGGAAEMNACVASSGVV